MFPMKCTLLNSCSLFLPIDVNLKYTDIKHPAADIKQISQNKEDHICRTVTNTPQLS